MAHEPHALVRRSGRERARRPLVALVFSFAAGTGAGLVWELPVPITVGGGLAAMLAGCLLRRTGSGRWASVLFLHIALCGAGWGYAQLRTEARLRLTQSPARGAAGDRRAVVARVAGDPRPRPIAAHGRYTARFEVVLLPTGELQDPVPDGRGRLPVTWFGTGDAPVPRYGEVWRLWGRMEPPAEYRRSDHRHVMVVDAANCRLLKRGGGHPFLRFCYRFREGVEQRLSRGIGDLPEARSMSLALLIGRRELLPRDRRESFAATGTVHIFAISGLHVGIVAGLMIAVLQLAGVSKVRWVYFVAPVLAVYTVATGGRASAVRAALMATIYLLGPAVHRKSDVLTALSLAALLILLWQPAQLFDVGFVFSFTVVLGLVMLYSPIFRLFQLAAMTDPFLDRVPAGRPPWPRLALRYLFSLTALSIAAWVSSAPLTAFFFGRLAPIALLGNIFVIPLALLIVLSGSLSLVIGILHPAFSVVYNHATVALVWVLQWLNHWLSKVPGGSLRVTDVSPWFLVFWYAGALWVAFWLHAVVDGLEQRRQAAVTVEPV